MGDTMGQGPVGAQDSAPPAPAEEQGEYSPTIISKAALGDQKVKEGDTLTFTVKSVDPETGDVEAVCEPGMGGNEDEQPGYASAFDKAMPEQGGKE